MSSQSPPRLRFWQWSLVLVALLAPGAPRAALVNAEGLDEAQRATLERIVAEVVEVRGLALREPLEVRVMTLAELQGILRRELEREFPSERLDGVVIALQALGALPPGHDLRGGLEALLLEQIGGLYDDEARRLCVMEWINFNSETARLILAHEVTHALQDQHFRIAESPIHARGESDRALAALAVLEGDAMAVMSECAVRHGGIAFFLELPQLLGMDQRALLATPAFLQGQLFFPYIAGQQFVMQAMLRHGGRAAVDRLMSPWPESTEQILHPERSALGAPDHPTPVSPEAARWGVPKGWTLAATDALGELGIRQIFQGVPPVGQAGPIADGWDGDRWAVWRDPASGGAALLWSSVWDGPEDAREFALGLRHLVERVPLSAVVDTAGQAVFAEPLSAVECRGATVHAAIWNGAGGVALTPPTEIIERVE